MGRHSSVAPGGRRRFARVRALLASALVLGIGATLTLAAWTDSESANASFGASVFDTESRTASTSWADHPAAPGATMAFPAVAMSPNTSRYAWIDVRTTADTSEAGTVTLAGIERTGVLADALVYRAVRTEPTADCAVAAFTAPGAEYIAGDAASALPSDAVGPSLGSPIAAAGGLLRFCFEVTLPSGAPSSLQGTTGSLTWTFGAVSE